MNSSSLKSSIDESQRIEQQLDDQQLTEQQLDGKQISESYHAQKCIRKDGAPDVHPLLTAGGLSELAAPAAVLLPCCRSGPAGIWPSQQPP